MKVALQQYEYEERIGDVARRVEVPELTTASALKETRGGSPAAPARELHFPHHSRRVQAEQPRDERTSSGDLDTDTPGVGRVVAVGRVLLGCLDNRLLARLDWTTFSASIC